jgi:hypothetical protein
MSRVITLNNCGLRGFDYKSRQNAKGRLNCSKVLSMKDKKAPKKTEAVSKGNTKIVFLSLVSVLVLMVFVSGAFYLYQVNDLATKGYEIRDMENRIQTLEKESKKMQIKEVELRSMYNIEKSTQELNLVSPQSITYVEMDSSVAMK